MGNTKDLEDQIDDLRKIHWNKAKEAEKLRRAHNDLERVYASLQHQYQIKEDELERTAIELEEYRTKLQRYDSGYFPSCKQKMLSCFYSTCIKQNFRSLFSQ